MTGGINICCFETPGSSLEGLVCFILLAYYMTPTIILDHVCRKKTE